MSNMNIKNLNDMPLSSFTAQFSDNSQPIINAKSIALDNSDAISRTTNNSSLAIAGGTSTAGGNGAVTLYGIEYSTDGNQGAVQIGSSTGKQLTIKRDRIIYGSGDNAHTITTDASSIYDNGKKILNQDSLAEDLTIRSIALTDGHSIRRTSDSGALQITGGTNDSNGSGKVVMYGKDYNAFPGGVSIGQTTGDASTDKFFNVGISSISYAGDVNFSGNFSPITFKNGFAIHHTANNGAINITGGKEFGDGNGTITLYGKERTGDAGRVSLGSSGGNWLTLDPDKMTYDNVLTASNDILKYTGNHVIGNAFAQAGFPLATGSQDNFFQLAGELSEISSQTRQVPFSGWYTLYAKFPTETTVHIINKTAENNGYVLVGETRAAYTWDSTVIMSVPARKDTWLQLVFTNAPVEGYIYTNRLYPCYASTTTASNPSRGLQRNVDSNNANEVGFDELADASEQNEVDEQDER